MANSKDKKGRRKEVKLGKVQNSIYQELLTFHREALNLIDTYKTFWPPSMIHQMDETSINLNALLKKIESFCPSAACFQKGLSMQITEKEIKQITDEAKKHLREQIEDYWLDTQNQLLEVKSNPSTSGFFAKKVEPAQEIVSHGYSNSITN